MQRAVRAGRRGLFALGPDRRLLDVMSSSGMADRRVVPYLRAAARRIAKRNRDVPRYALGAADACGRHQRRAPRQDARGGGGAARRVAEHPVRGRGRPSERPRHLTDGTSVPPRDGRVLVRWLCCDPNAAEMRSSQHWHERMSAWAAANDLVTHRGEWSVGPPGNSTVAANIPQEFPRHSDAPPSGR